MRYLVLLLLLAVAPVWAVNYVWREAETADKSNFPLTLADGKLNRNGEPENLISGGKWVMTGFDPTEHKDEDPDLEWSYNFTIPKKDDYKFWLRVGWEYARAPLQWRVDGGEWQKIGTRTRTRDMIELGFWLEIGWLNPATLTLDAGPHTLDMRVVEFGGSAKSPECRLALDVVAFVPGDWTPCAALKPGEEPSGPTDEKAAASVFTLPTAKGAADRTEVSLTGLWQVCRDDDPDMMQGTYDPQTKLPPANAQHWRGAFIPANQWQPLPAANEYAHRVWYRARVQVPAAYAGRGFLLHCFGTNWIASVVVNGQYCGFTKSVRVPWDIDITQAVKPGQVNEVCIGIKDLWYGIDGMGKPIDDVRNMPLGFVQKFAKVVAPFFPSTKGDADGTVCGITDWVNFVAAGAVYTQNVAIRPSVAKKTLTVVATVLNPTDKDVEVAVGAESILESSGLVEHTIPPVPATIPAGKSVEVTLAAPWANPKLWWPDVDPAPIYRLRTTLTRAGVPVDIFEHEQWYGFREITLDGIYFRVNGERRNFWNLLGGLHGGTLDEKLANFRAEGNRFERFSADISLGPQLGPRCYQLDWTDKHGVAGRLSTMIDGMSIAFNLRNPVTWENFNAHIDQVTRAYRNHPSVMVYSLENELLLINGRLGCGDMPMVEGRAKAMQDIAHRNDPTRPCMMDGAGALQDNYLDICNTHYAEDGFVPNNAEPLGDTDANAPGVTKDPSWRGDNSSAFEGLWKWDHQRPYCAGEIAYFSGDNIDHAWIGGETAAQDRTQARIAYARYIRYLLERYRWNDVAMVCPWVGDPGMAYARPAMSALAAFTREYNTCFFAEKPFTRTVKVFNDTFSHEPVTFTWTLDVNGKKVGGGTQQMTIAPGFGQVTTITATLPAVAARTPLQLILEVAQPGSPSFRDVKEYAIYPAPKPLKAAHPVFLLGDPTFAGKLATLGVTAKPISTLAEAAAGSLVVIAPHTTPLPAVTEFVKAGGRVVCLEQSAPFEGDTLPAPLTVAHVAKKPVFAYWVFPAGMESPLFTGMAEADFANWAGFTPTADTLWDKPAGLARPWLVAGNGLHQTAMVEEKSGAGIVLATQMQVGGRWDTDPAARRLLANMLAYADGYTDPARPVSVFATPHSGIEKFVNGLGCRLRDDRPLEKAVLSPAETPVLVVQANRDNLETLNDHRADVDKYVAAGGWIMLWGVEPDALHAFNRLVGAAHVLREFRAERVALRRDPMTTGLDNTEFAMLSKEKLAEWESMLRVSQDIFTYCVDAADDVAPFCFGPPNAEYKFGDGGGALATVNGFTNADFWKYIDQGWAPKPGTPFVTYTLPGPCTLSRVNIWNNANYNTIKELDIVVDGKTVATVTLPDGSGAVETTLPDLPATATVSLTPKSYYHGDGGMVGLDMVQLTRKTPEWAAGKVVPLTENGGLVCYPRGKGGFVLNQLKLAVNDTNDYVAKRQRIVTALLHNMGASFDEIKAVEEGPGDVEVPGE